VASERLASVIERLAVDDPDLLRAADEVDVDLLRWFAQLSPRERLDRACRAGADLERLRHARRLR
jgi:hypothetical protein